MAAAVFMLMFALFSERHPQVELHISVFSSNASLSQREADVAIPSPTRRRIP